MNGVLESLAAGQRLLTKLRHDPTSIVLTLAAPVVLVLVFGYIFGSAIAVPGSTNYREFLVPGLFASIATNIVPSMVSTARDSSRGVVDRFRSLPITRVAVPLGQAGATSVYALLNFVLMALCGLAVGWRFHRGIGAALTALGLLLLFQLAITWVGMFVGLWLGNEEAAAQLSILALPVAMMSNIFVPTSGMPGWLRFIADRNPASALTAALRQLFGNPTAPTNGAWVLEHPVPATLIWSALLLAVFIPLATARYARPVP
jgi:ABC-2 type transport system permease protein